MEEFKEFMACGCYYDHALVVIVHCPLHSAAPLMKAALKNEVIQLANMAAMVDPIQTQEYMTSVYAAIATADKKVE